MADWSKLVEGFQQGADFSQNFRARRQLEKYRDNQLEGMDYDMQSRRANRRLRDPMTAGALGELDPASVQDYQGLEDPFAFKLFDWIKTKVRRRKKSSAIPTGEPPMPSPDAMAAPEAAPEESAVSYALPDQEQAYADGGLLDVQKDLARSPNAQQNVVTTVPAGGAQPVQQTTGPVYRDGGAVETEEDKIRRRAQENRARNPGRVENPTETVKGADRTAAPKRSAINVKGIDKKAGDFINVRPKEGMGKLRTGARAVKGAGALGALASTALDTAATDTEDYRKRFGLETNDPSLLGDMGVRALGAASDLGNAMTFGAAGRFYRDKEEAPEAEPLMAEQGEAPELPTPDTAGSVSSGMSTQRTALPAQRQQKYVDFSDVEAAPNDVPNMQLNDWMQYRARMMDAARQTGRPEDLVKAGNAVTQMQMEGFHSYGMQGLALMQSGNLRAAQNAFRAAFQYFPNGNDVEFGTHRDPQTGQMQLVGFGKDERTGKVVPGSEIVMAPERVGVLLENFKNPQAWRMWTKDWRDFEQGQREYEEVKKPLAQAQADYMANNAESNALRAENTALRSAGAGGAGAAANMRNAERVFRERVGAMLGDEAQADYLAAIMSQVKARNPGTPDNMIMQAIMQSYQDGSLEQRLSQMGISGQPQTPGAAPAAPQASAQAIPTGENTGVYGNDYAEDVDEELQQMSPEERRWATTPAQ